MPRVVFDSQVFAEQRHGGVSRYFLSLAEWLVITTRWSPLVAPGVHVSDLPLPSGVQSFGPRLRMPAYAHSFRVRRGINTFTMALFRPRNDHETVFHPTWYHRPALDRWSHLPLVVTIHDVIPESWPAVTTATQLADRKHALERARAVVCVSQTTAELLADRYPWAASKVTVALPGLSPLPKPIGSETYTRPYVLHVGKRGAYKDFATVMRSLSRCPPELRIVAVGGGQLRPWERELISAHGFESRMSVEAYVSDQRLADLLAASTALVSASRAEGFGLPALEALAAGKPVVLSDIPVYRELYGDWAEFFPPGDAEAMGSAISQVLVGVPARLPSRDELEARFSWKRSAEVTAGVYDAALG